MRRRLTGLAAMVLTLWVSAAASQSLEPPLGGDPVTQISDQGPPGQPGFEASHPAAIYDPRFDVHAVVYQGTTDLGGGDKETNIFLVPISGVGQVMGPAIQISPSDGNPLSNALLPQIVCFPQEPTNPCVVTWLADQRVDGEFELWGRTISLQNVIGQALFDLVDSLLGEPQRLTDYGPPGNADWDVFDSDMVPSGDYLNGGPPGVSLLWAGERPEPFATNEVRTAITFVRLDLEPITGALIPRLELELDPPEDSYVPYDPDLALALLEEAGWTEEASYLGANDFDNPTRTRIYSELPSTPGAQTSAMHDLRTSDGRPVLFGEGLQSIAVGPGTSRLASFAFLPEDPAQIEVGVFQFDPIEGTFDVRIEFLATDDGINDFGPALGSFFATDGEGKGGILVNVTEQLDQSVIQARRIMIDKGRAEVSEPQILGEGTRPFVSPRDIFRYPVRVDFFRTGPANDSPAPSSGGADTGIPGGYLVTWDGEVTPGDREVLGTVLPLDTCVPGPGSLCLNQDLYRVGVRFRTSQGKIGPGQAVELTDDTGYFWFFDDTNVEVVIKVLEACGLNDSVWVFAAGLTNTQVEITVEEVGTGRFQIFENPLNTAFVPIQNTSAFSCSGRAAAGFEPDSHGPLLSTRRPVPISDRLPLVSGGGACLAGDTVLCLNRDRFQASATFRTSRGETGDAQVVEITDDTGYYTFFDPTNVEVVMKVLDGCALNGHFWVFAAGLTNVEVTLTVTDTQTGARQTYNNPLETRFAAIQDTSAFPCS